jgi:hypothetical protein
MYNIQDKSAFSILLLDLIRQKEEHNNRVLTYAGIGARATPVDLIKKLSYIAKRLEHQWFHLLTGGADGADTAFLAGTQFFTVFMPSHYFKQRISNRVEFIDCSGLPNWNEAIQLAHEHHYNSKLLNEFSLKLVARNAYCILGLDLKTPVDFVLCWTPNAKLVGGTAQALKIANAYSIPVFNLADVTVFTDVLRVLKLDRD